MDRKTAWFAGAAAAALLGAGAFSSGPASAAPLPPAYSYADLLEPVPDATARLAVDDAAQQHRARLETVQYWEHHHHHHHHHHHSRQWYGDNGYYWNGGGWALMPEYDYRRHSRGWYEGRGYYWNGWAWAPRAHHHHHHHHHHHQYGY